MVVISASAAAGIYTQGKEHRLCFDLFSTVPKAACKTFAVSTDRRKDREMVTGKMRWKDKEGGTKG